VTTASHLQISGGVLSVVTVVTAERRYGPFRLSDDNNNIEYAIPNHRQALA